MRVLQYSPRTLVKVPNVYGSGIDGSVVYSVDTTLTGDVNARTVVINPGVTLYTNGFRVFATVSIINNGVISCVGKDAITYGPPSYSLGAPWGTLPGGCDTLPQQGAGVAVAAFQPEGPFSSLSGSGGTSGTGGGEGSNAGGGRSTTYGTSTLGINIVDALHVDNGRINTDGFHIGGIAGGGTCSGGSNTGYGQGGGGGGIVLLSAPRVDNTSGSITVSGGAGSIAQLANHGGGGGGAGGVIICIGDIVVQGTCIISGGAGGAALGSGTAGAAGSAGRFIAVRSQ